MRFSTQALFAALAAGVQVLAQTGSSSNPFTNSVYNITAGQPFTLNWTPTTSGPVSLILRSGASSNLIAGTYIAQSVTNSGTYTWNVDSTITRGSDYTVQIVDVNTPTNINFTPFFVIESKNTVASSTGVIALGATTGSVIPTNTATTISGSQTGSSASSAISSANSVASSISSSISSLVSSASTAAAGSSSRASSSGSSASGAMSSSMASSMASSSRATSASSSAAATSASTVSAANGAGPTFVPAAGLLGMLALGALAL